MKSQANITIDIDVLLEARRRNLNLSKTINEFLRTYLEMPEEERPDTRVETEIELKKAQAKVFDLQQHLKKKEKESMRIY